MPRLCVFLAVPGRQNQPTAILDVEFFFYLFYLDGKSWVESLETIQAHETIEKTAFNSGLSFPLPELSLLAIQWIREKNNNIQQQRQQQQQQEEARWQKQEPWQQQQRADWVTVRAVYQRHSFYTVICHAKWLCGVLCLPSFFVFVWCWCLFFSCPIMYPAMIV